MMPPLKKPQRNMYFYHKGGYEYESMRKDAFEFAMEKYFNGYSDPCSVQENLEFDST